MRREDVIWPDTLDDARRLQRDIAQQVRCDSGLPEFSTIGGVDTAYNHEKGVIVAAAWVGRYPDLRPLHKAVATGPVTFPYHPGLFFFREGPTILEALARLRELPDVLLVAAHGLAHPRGCGMAGHVGVLLDIPTIGCARKRLCGEHDDPGEEPGAAAKLYVHNREAGIVLRTRAGVKPVFVSPGHRCDLQSAHDTVVACLRGYRLPEPIRTAHRLANKIKHTIEAAEYETMTGK